MRRLKTVIRDTRAALEETRKRLKVVILLIFNRYSLAKTKGVWHLQSSNQDEKITILFEKNNVKNT